MSEVPESVMCVRFLVDSPVPPRDDVLDYVQRIKGRVIAIGDDGCEAPIGKVLCKLVRVTLAIADDVSMTDVCDADSETLEFVHAALFDDRDDELREELSVDHCRDILYLEAVSMRKRLAAPDVIARVIDSACETFCAEGLIVASSRSRFMSPRVCKLLGFQKLTGRELLLRDMGMDNPYAGEG